MDRQWLEQIDAAADPADAIAAAAYLAARSLDLDRDELRAAVRRSLLLLATGGDPRRELAVESRAVAALARDLDAPERRAAVTAALERLLGQADELPRAAVALRTLLSDAELAWRWTACALLGDELSDDDA